MKTLQQTGNKIFFVILLLAGIIFSTEAGAKKLKVKNRMMTYEDLIELVNSEQSDRVVFMINGIETSVKNVSEIPKGWILFIEMMNKPKAAFLSFAGKYYEKECAINICVIRPETGGDEEYSDFEPRFPMHEKNGFTNWVSKKVSYPSPTEGLIKGEERKALIYFTVEADGTLSEFSFDETSDKQLANHLIKVLQGSPRWSPAIINGVAVRRECALPYNVWLAANPNDTNPGRKVPDVRLNHDQSHRFLLSMIKRTVNPSNVIIQRTETTTHMTRDQLLELKSGTTMQNIP